MEPEPITKQRIEEIIARVRDSKMPGSQSLDSVASEIGMLISKASELKTVLGIDIYRYSKIEYYGQAVVPHVMRSILTLTAEHLLENESAFYPGKSGIDLEKDFLDTGDGGFLIFKDPMRALLFLIYFQANMQLYNNANLWPELIAMTKSLSIRYCLTMQNLYIYQKGWYGPAIINNARILAADKLNRLLIDQKTKEWFDMNTNGIETLAILGLLDFKKGAQLSKLFPKAEERGSLLFPKESRTDATFRAINLSHIGEVDIKSDKFSVHNLHLQCQLIFKKAAEIEKNVITIGNLNTSGIGII
jgi:hypothetical protein